MWQFGLPKKKTKKRPQVQFIVLPLNPPQGMEYLQENVSINPVSHLNQADQEVVAQSRKRKKKKKSKANYSPFA